MGKKPLCLLLILSVGLPISASEDTVILAAVNRNVPEADLRPSFVRLLKAIRKQENGGPVREFGIMDPRAKTLDQQAGWCAQKCYAEYRYWRMFERKNQDYIPYLASQYTMTQRDEWIKNVEYYYNKEGL